jgi:hypothetical protein
LGTRSFSGAKKPYDQFNKKLDEGMEQAGSRIEEVKTPDAAMDKLKVSDETLDEIAEKVKSFDLSDPKKKELLQKMYSVDPSELFDEKTEVLESIKYPVGDLTDAECEAAVKEFEASDKYKPDPNTDINQNLPWREKVKAADLGESYGPAKHEMDSWKRIYAEEESFERLGLPPRAHYWRDGEMYSPFGTLSNPVKVYSQFSHRIVGCRGGNGRPHEIVWVNLGNKYKTMCPECGQMFMLVNYQPDEDEQPHERLHAIDKLKNDGQLKEPQMY